MAIGNTASITVPIQAKIEGWQAELKRIQDEAKKVNLGSQFGRELQKNIADLEKQINSMSQTLTRKLTSESGIDNFNDKLNDIETRFKVIGDTLSRITLEDLNTSYVDSQLKSLVDRVNELQTKLNSELDITFGDKIVTEATKVQKAFARVGQSEQDIKSLGREGTRAALEGIVADSIKTIDEANEKINNLKNNISALKQAEKNWQPNVIAQTSDVNAYISSIVSTNAADYGLKPLINEEALEQVRKKIETQIEKIKLSDAKKKDIKNYLEDLVPTSSITVITERIGNIRQVLQSITGLSAFDLDSSSFNKYLNSIVNSVDTNALDESLNRIKERFIADGVTEEDLNKFWGAFSDSIKNQDFDKAIEIVSTNITQLQEEYKKGKEKIAEARKALEEALKLTQSQQFKAAWTRTYGEEALKELDALIERYIKASETAKELEETQNKLNDRKKEILQPTQKVGQEVSDSAVQRWYENTSAAQVYKSELDQIKSREQMLGKIEGLIQRWFSVYAVVRIVNNAIKSVINTVQELDKTITEIAIVTKMDQNDLWGQMDSYTALARQYAASISGVYKVSQLYYQQGLQTADVMALTEQTLKMARISGLDYAQATDYMTNAIRSFKMEMTEAQNVVDVYSAIAASSATSVTELASAMSKTASSAQAVGSSFENTTAMMAVMIEATRESAENIGSAMKSIISRYGEMTSDPSKLVDSEGQEMSLNRVDKALQTVGISIHNVAGEFRNFDDVIMELAEKWDTIDTNTQRYIATIMAGNRQQSRFLALVSSYDRLKELSAEAANSENASQLQFLKTLDSVQAKTQQLQTSLQSLYTSSGVEKLYKTILDLGNRIVQTFTNMETLGGFPVLALTRLGTTFTSLALIVTNVFKVIKTQYSLNLKQLELLQTEYLTKIKPLKQQEVALEKEKNMAETEDAKRTAEEKLQIVKEELAKEEQAYNESVKRRSTTRVSMTTGQKVGMVASAAGMIGSTVASTMDQNTQRELKGWTTLGSSLASAVGTFAFMGGGWAGALMAVATALSGALEGIGILTETVDEKVNRLKSDIETTSNTKLQSKDSLQTLIDYKKKYDELSKAQYQSAEDKKAFIEIQNEIAASYPELISSMSVEGNYVVDMTSAYQQLAQAKQMAYQKDFITNLQAELNGLSDINYILDQYYHQNILSSESDLVQFLSGNSFSKVGNLTESLALGTSEERINSIKSWLNPASLTDIFTDVSDGIKNLNIFEQMWEDVATGAVGHAFPAKFENNSKDIYAQLINDFFELAQNEYTLPEAKLILGEKDIYADYIQAINGFKQEVYNSFQAESNAIQMQQNLLDNAMRAKVSEWTQILTDLSGKTTGEFQSEVITNKLLNAWEKFEKGVADGTIEGFVKVGDEFTDNSGVTRKKTTADLFGEFLTQFSTNLYFILEEQTRYLQDEEIESLYKNRGQYSINALQQQEGFKKLGEYTQDFLDDYNEDYKDVFERYEAFLTQDTSFINNEKLQQTLSNFKTSIGPDFIQGIIDQYQKILKNQNLSDNIKAGQIDTLTQAIDSLQNLSSDDQIKALSTLQTADFTSLFGIYQFLENLKQKDIKLDGTGIIEAFNLFSHTLTLNLESELNSYTDTLSTISENYSKDLSNAIKGVDLKTASDMAKKYNISLKGDFDYTDNKFFLKNLDAIKEFYLKQYEDYSVALSNTFDTELSQYQKLSGQNWNFTYGKRNRKFNWDDIFNKTITEEGFNTYFQDERTKTRFTEETGIDFISFQNMYSEFLNSTQTNFFKFVETYYSDQLDIYSQYFKDLEQETLKTAAKTYLSSGDIKGFANIIFDKQENKDTLTKFLLDAFEEGDLNNILQFIPAEYGQTVIDTFKDSIKNVYDSFSLEDNIGKLITSDALNASTLAALELDGLATHFIDEGNNVIYKLAAITEENIDTYIESIKNATHLTSSDKATKLAEAHAFKYKDKISALTTALSDMTVDYSSAENLAEALGYTKDQAEQAMNDLGFVLDAATGKWRRGADSLEKIKLRIDELKTSASLEDLNQLYALEDAGRSYEVSEQSKAISDILKNYNSFSSEILKNLATALSMNYNDLKSQITIDNYDGTYALNFSSLQQLLHNKDLPQAVQNMIEETISSIADDYLSKVSSAANYAIKGTNKVADMQKFINEYQKLLPNDLSVADAFSYDTLLDSFTLNANIMNEYVEAQKNELQKLGLNETAINEYIKDQTKTLLQQNINVEDFFNAVSSKERSIEATKLANNIQNYLDVTQKSVNEIIDATVNARIEQLDVQYDELMSRSLDKKISWAEWDIEWGKLYQEELKVLSYKIGDLSAETIVTILDAGGKNAVELLKQLKGENVTTSELEAAFNNSQIVKLRTAMSDLEKGVGETVTGLAMNIMQVTDGFELAQLDDGSAVITAVGDMVEAYANLYAAMKNNADTTTRDLNSTYVKLLNAADQKNIDTLDVLENAAGMTYDAFAEILTRYGKTLEDALSHRFIQSDGFGKVRITDFDRFTQYMGFDINSPEYTEAYSSWVDSMIELQNQPKQMLQNITDSIKELADAKPGDKINVSYLAKALHWNELDTLLQDKLRSYAAHYEDGILSLADGADIPGLITAVANEAANAGILLPEQLAELADTIADMLSKITSLIKNGISGNLTHNDSLSLQNWAKNQNIDNLQFIETANGLQLTADSITDVYTAMKKVDALQAQSLLPNIQSANNNYSNLYTTLRELNDQERQNVRSNTNVRDSYDQLSQVMLTALEKGTVITDFYLRPHIIDNEELQTYLSVSESNEKGETVLVTPILPNGQKFSEDWAADYASQYANKEITLDTKLVGEDGKELKYTFKDIFMGMYDSVEAADAAAAAYHNYHQAIMDAESGTEGLNNTVSKTTALMQDLVRSMMVDPDQFNFMSNSLPDGMQSVVNAFENASQGITTLTEANKQGTMGVQDFYNVVMTASSLMEAAGKEFNVKGLNAAQLIQAAGENLVIVDGKLKVDLSNAGLDLVGGGVDTLKDNLHTGIQELANAQIEMLDAEIQVLEILAAMEEIGNVDVNGNGISFEVEDMFGEPDLSGVRQFNDDMLSYLGELKTYADTHKEVETALKSIQLGNKNLYELVSSKDWAEWQAAGFTEQSLSQFLQTLTTMDWDVDNIQKQVADVLSGLSIGVQVQLDHGLYVFSITGEQFSFNWDNKETMARAEAAIAHFWEENGESTQERVQKLVQAYLTEKNADGKDLTVEDKYKIHLTLALASGEITYKHDEETDTWIGNYKNTQFRAGSEEQLLDLIGKAMSYTDQGYQFEYDGKASIKGKLSIGKEVITIDDSGMTTLYYVNGTAFYSLEEAKAYLASQGQASASDAGLSFTSKGGETWNIYTDAETHLTYTVKQGDTPDYAYDGKHFGTYQQLLTYLQFRSKGAQGTINTEATEVEFESGLKIKYVTDGNTAEIKYYIGDKPFKDEIEAAKYIEAQRKPGAVVSTNGETITYSFEGYNCQATFKANEGTIKYVMTLPNGTVEADSEASLRAAIAALINKDSTEGSETIQPINFTFTTTGKTTIKVENGEVNEDDSTAKDLITQVKENLEAYTKAHPAQVAANAEATSVSIALAEGAVITLDTTDGLSLSNTIPSVTGTVDTLTLTPKTIKVNNAPTDTTNVDAPEINNDTLNTEITNTLSGMATTAKTESQEIGGNVDEGYVNGIRSKMGEVNSASAELSENSMSAIASAAGVASPSTITTEIGENVGQGLIDGMSSKIGEVTSIGESLGSAATSGVSSGMDDMEKRIENATGSIRSHFDTLKMNVITAVEEVKSRLQSIQQHISFTWDIVVDSTSPFISSILAGNYAAEGSGNFGQVGSNDVGSLKVEVVVDKDEAESNLSALSEAATTLDSIDPTIVVTALAGAALGVINSIKAAIANIEGNHVITFEAQKTGNWPSESGGGKAAGNFGQAKAAGTLMGELGPELVVQNGRYFVAGQNGAEFVNLKDDAIVFNHLQTEQLLKKGMSSTRGRAVTNERNAVAFAQGNINGGPAMASASAALAALKQLRSMWQSLASASIQDLAGAGGGGGGGGGGKDMAAYIKELEKWYNWLQKIAELEDKINYQEQLRSTISSSQRKNGSAYYSSMKDTLKNLQEQVKTEQSLVDAQQKYFDKRRKELNTSGPFNSLYTFDENGQLKYKKGALNKLSKLNETDKYGKPKMSAEEQYSYIVNTLGIDEQYLQTTASGEKIDTSEEGWQATAVQAFWDKMDADKEEMQSLHDSVNEHKEALLAAQEKQNELLQEMRDNQLAVEQNVYDAIVDSRERAIEDAEAMRDAIEDSTSKFIDGLSSALDKERSMYEMQQSQSDLDQKRRRLAILQRTGGSNSEIASLQSDIASSERDLYFDKQQEQIDLIQEASDKQIEKLDQQIELDRELLEYQKAHGLLWGEVAEIMKMDSAAITDFITSNNSEWWAKSPVQSQQDLQDAIFQTDQWVEFRDDQNSFFQDIIDTIYNTTTNAAPDNPTSTADSTTQLDDNGNGSDDTTVKYKKLDDKYHTKITTKKDKKGKKKTTKKKEKHDFDDNGKCTKCGFKKKKTNNGNNDGNGDNGSNGDNGTGAEPITTKFKYEQHNSVIHYKIPVHSDGTTGKKISEDHTFKDGVCIHCKYEKTNQRSATSPMNNNETKLNDSIKEYTDAVSRTQASNSLADLKLTSEEMRLLHNATLSTNLSAVDSAMKMGIQAIDSSAYTTIDRTKSTQIGSISLNMDVKQIANDYDAKRAGEQAMEEMLRIARKSTTATVRR